MARRPKPLSTRSGSLSIPLGISTLPIGSTAASGPYGLRRRDAGRDPTGLGSCYDGLFKLSSWQRRARGQAGITHKLLSSSASGLTMVSETMSRRAAQRIVAEAVRPPVGSPPKKTSRVAATELVAGILSPLRGFTLFVWPDRGLTASATILCAAPRLISRQHSCFHKRTIYAGLLVFAALALGITLPAFSQRRPQAENLLAAADAAQIIIDPSNPTATEITVNEGNTLQLKPRVLDSAGNVIDNAPLSYSSLSSDIATVDASGTIQGKAAGFSTLAVASGTVVATATITVTKITAGASGFEITGVAQDLARRLYLADTRDHTILLAEDLEKTPNVYAGINQTSGLVNDERLKSLFKNPAFLAFNQGEGTLYVSDSANHVIRLVRPGPSGKVEALAGTGQAGEARRPAQQREV